MKSDSRNLMLDKWLELDPPLHQESGQVGGPAVEDDERRVRASRVPLRDERGGHAARLQRERL